MPHSDIDFDSFEDVSARCDARRLVLLLQRFLPLRARLPARARGAAEPRRLSPGSVTQVFDAGAEMGVLCQVQFADAGSIVLAPITKLSFDRGCPVFREIAAYQKCRRARTARESGPRA